MMFQTVYVPEKELLALLRSGHDPALGPLVPIGVPPDVLERARRRTRRDTTRNSSTSGRVRYAVLGEEGAATSAIEALVQVLRRLADLDPQLLDRLSQRLVGRKRRQIARSAAEIHPDRRDLRGSVKPILRGWYVNSNISNREKAQILEAACEEAGLVWGQDVQVDLGRGTGPD